MRIGAVESDRRHEGDVGLREALEEHQGPPAGEVPLAVGGGQDRAAVRIAQRRVPAPQRDERLGEVHVGLDRIRLELPRAHQRVQGTLELLVVLVGERELIEQGHVVRALGERTLEHPDRLLHATGLDPALGVGE